jgi:sRNA-binding protein
MTGHPRIAGRLTLPGFRAKTPVVEEPPALEIPPKPRAPALVAVLAEKWPAVFGQGATVPLAIGVYAEIQTALAGTVSNRQVAEALRWWCGRNSYLAALGQPGARRHVLDGSDAGAVSDRDREHAAQTLVERQRKKTTK